MAPAERRDHIRRIHDLVTSLRDAAHKSPYPWIVNPNLSTLLGEDTVDDIATNLFDEIDWDALQGASGNPEMARHAREFWNDRWTADALERAAPAFTSILDRFAKSLELESKRRQKILQPGDSDAERHYFVRSIAEHFRYQFGRPHNAHVARVTNAVYGSDITAKSVEDLVSTTTPPARRRFKSS